MKAYSQDLRERVLRAVDLGRPRAEVVQLFGVSLPPIKRYLKQRREEGHLRPRWRPTCCPIDIRTMMPDFRNTVPCGSKLTANA